MTARAMRERKVWIRIVGRAVCASQLTWRKVAIVADDVRSRSCVSEGTPYATGHYRALLTSCATRCFLRMDLPRFTKTFNVRELLNSERRHNPIQSLYPDRLPRLPREYYQGDAFVHWTLSVHKRQTGWLTDQFHESFRELMIQ